MPPTPDRAMGTGGLGTGDWGLGYLGLGTGDWRTWNWGLGTPGVGGVRLPIGLVQGDI